MRTVSLRPLSASNRQAVEALSVAPSQEQFVSGVADSLREAADEPGGRALCWAVYAGDTPVRFVMISDDVAGPDYIPHYLWKLLIVEYFRGRPGVEVLSTSAGQGDGSPIGFYESYGFKRTGEIVFDDEILLRLELNSLPPPE